MTEIDDLKTRYARQMSLPEVGEEGQMRLAEKRVAIIGAGGLGSALLPLLVGAGVGHLTLCDDDSISVSNLPRQTLYTTHEVGRSKAQCAAERLRAANPHCDITAYSERLPRRMPPASSGRSTFSSTLPTTKRHASSSIATPQSTRSRGSMPRSRGGADSLHSSSPTHPHATETSSPRELRETTQAPRKPPSP